MCWLAGHGRRLTRIQLGERGGGGFSFGGVHEGGREEGGVVGLAGLGFICGKTKAPYDTYHVTAAGRAHMSASERVGAAVPSLRGGWGWEARVGGAAVSPAGAGGGKI